MADPVDIFDKDGQKIEETPAVVTPAANEDKVDEVTNQLLSAIVNPDGSQKYSTIEEALKASAHAQTHIQNLEKEAAELQEKNNADSKLDELLEAVKKSQGGGNDEGNPVSAISPEDVLGIVKQYVTETKDTETQEGNIDSVAKVFRDRYGKDASEKLYGTAEDLGLSREEINRMIATNPKAALKVLGVKPKDVVSDPVTGDGGVGTLGFRDAPEAKPTSVMGTTKKGALEDAWKLSKERTHKKLGVEILPS